MHSLFNSADGIGSVNLNGVASAWKFFPIIDKQAAVIIRDAHFLDALGDVRAESDTEILLPHRISMAFHIYLKLVVFFLC